jgi:hypothetical protein
LEVCLLCRHSNSALNADELLLDDEVVYLIDETEKVWLLRSLVAKMLSWFNSGRFLVAHLTHANSKSTEILLLSFYPF